MIVITGNHRPIKAWVSHHPTDVDAVDIEPAALQQARNLAQLSFIASNGVALMPDVHSGKGSTIGSVIATERAIIPAAVGVDIGCGMNAVRLSLRASDLPDSLTNIRHQIERDIPLGAGGAHQFQRILPGMSLEQRRAVEGSLFGEVSSTSREKFCKKAAPQLGTLGSGNHFIEICVDEHDDVWVMLHSGSRGIGNMIGTHFIERAKRRMEQYFIHLPDSDLAFLPEDTDDFREYVCAVEWAQNYALENRRVMMETVIAALHRHIPVEFTTTMEAVNCHHNYIDREHHFGRNMWITRKGAIRAREGDLGIIPGSMGQRSYVVQGLGHPQSYCSCSHGAGRRMSRSEARRTFTIADLHDQTMGVECRKDQEIIDEIPAAYKDIDTVMHNQRDLVTVLHTLRAVLCVKGS